MSADAFKVPAGDVIAAYPCGMGNELAPLRKSDMERLDPSAVAPMGERRWSVDADVLADALDQTRPYNGDREASDHAWSARLDAAVHGIDVVDSAGLDAWMASHAAAQEPHLLEAELVAAWETHVRAHYADDTSAQTAEPVRTADLGTEQAAAQDVDRDAGWEL